MQVFVTGASGFIGSATVAELLGAGHEVVGLARSDAAAAALTAAGAGVHRGDLDDLAGLRRAADAADGVIHLAFKHDIAFSGRFQDAADADLRVLETFGAALEASDRPLVFASATGLLAPGRVGTEDDDPDLDNPHNPRVGNDRTGRDLAARGVRVSAVRFAPTVHGEGDHGFIAALARVAREKGVSGYLGDGANRWAAVHRLDAAQLVRLALEKAPAGTALHAVAEEGVPIRAVAEAIGRALDLPVAAVASERAAEHFGFLAGFVGADLPASSARTRELLGWQPTGPTLLADLDAGHYPGT